MLLYIYISTSEPAENLLLTIILYENEKETDYAAGDAGLHERQRATVYRLPFLNHNFLLQTCWLTDDLGGLFLYMPQMGENGQIVVEWHAFKGVRVWG